MPAAKNNVWNCAKQDIANLCALAQEDQADRTGTINWDVVTPRDRARKSAVSALFKNTPLNTRGDYFHAALIFQHGETWEDFATAHLLAVRGLQLSPTDPNLQRMVAASWDRMMHSMQHRQWFGTNIFRDSNGTPLPKEVRPDLLPQSLIEDWSKPWQWPK